MSKNITVVGCGYVGFTLGLLLSKKFSVKIFDIDHLKIKKLNKGISPIKDNLAEEYLKNKSLDISGTTDAKTAFSSSDIIVIAISVDYDDNKGRFDTAQLDKLLSEIVSLNNKATIILKSTIPVGYTRKVKKKLSYERIYFSPEFLREGSALQDNLYPSRLVIGDVDENSKEFLSMLEEVSELNNVEKIFTQSDEAEAIKLFANTYLALRVSFFNELDNYALSSKLDSKNIIKGISLDTRIGDFYNNPSFGYGGYCLPKDSKQLSRELLNIPSPLIDAVIESNRLRKKFIASIILNKGVERIGIYKLAMKLNSDNHRQSAILDIIKDIKNHSEITIYDSSIKEDTFMGFKVERNLQKFLENNQLIIANRFEKDLENHREKVFTRDIFNYL